MARKIISTVGGLVVLLASYAIPKYLEVNNMITQQNSYWLLYSLLIGIFVFIGTLVWGYWSMLKNIRFQSPITNKQSQIAPVAPVVEYFPTRDDFRKSESARLMDEAETIWALWHTGAQTTTTEQYVKWNIRRMLLADKDNDAFFAKFTDLITDKDPYTQYHKNTIVTFTSRLEEKLKGSSRDRQDNECVKWYSETPTMLMTIGNPDKNNGWILVQLLIPYIKDAGKRPCILYRRQTNEPEFTLLLQSFESFWKNARKPDPSEYVLKIDK